MLKQEPEHCTDVKKTGQKCLFFQDSCVIFSSKQICCNLPRTMQRVHSDSAARGLWLLMTMQSSMHLWSGGKTLLMHDVSFLTDLSPFAFIKPGCAPVLLSRLHRLVHFLGSGKGTSLFGHIVLFYKLCTVQLDQVISALQFLHWHTVLRFTKV